MGLPLTLLRAHWAAAAATAANGERATRAPRGYWAGRVHSRPIGLQRCRSAALIGCRPGGRAAAPMAGAWCAGGGGGAGGCRAAWVCRGGARALPQALRDPAPRGIGPAASDGPAGGSVPLGSLAVGASALRQGEVGPRALREGGAGVGSTVPSSGRAALRVPHPPGAVTAAPAAGPA